MIRLLRLAIPIIVLAIFIHTGWADKPVDSPLANSSAGSPARAVAQEGITQILDVLRDRALDREGRADKMNKIMEEWLDFDTFSRLSIGPSWREWTDGQRGQFVEEFKRHMLGIATKSTKGYDDEDVVIVADDQEKNGDHTIRCRVLGKIKDGVQEDIGRVDFRLRQKEERWKVIDVHVAGISMANTFRAQFLVIMKDGG
ncbi:MAG TPA: ABC transporter substrate-binding protein, partial [Tepidisphaeraceae bacterium]|nr:ABC transporter substrate-binding protein [Tepidisphaeraceae bacterium]